MEHISVKEIAEEVWNRGIRAVLKDFNSGKDNGYNDVEVYWCNACKSLKIMNIETLLDDSIKCYCGECYGTDIVKGHINDWEKIKNKLN
jgi:hypothetical protein